MDDNVHVVRLTNEEHGVVVNVLYEKHNDLVRNDGPYEIVCSCSRGLTASR